jgi:hypothetical protein
MITGLAKLYVDIRTALLGIPDRSTFSFKAKFTGSGLNDATFNTTALLTDYTGMTTSRVFTVTATNSNTFSWTDGTTTRTGLPIHLSNTLTDGVVISFASLTGHTDGDVWTLTISAKPQIKYCNIYNNQYGLEVQGKTYDFLKPAVFIEMQNMSDIQQLGTGKQIYNELVIRLHVVHEFYNSTDGNGDQEQNLPIFELKQNIYATIDLLVPDGSVGFVRINEIQNYDHENLYIYMQDYRTNFIDGSRERPIGFILKTPPTDLITSVTYETPPYIHP